MESDPRQDSAEEAVREEDDDALPVRPRGFWLAAGIAGGIAGAFFVIAVIMPVTAPYLAAVAVFAGVLIGALLMRRARDRELAAALGPAEEASADRAWEMNDIAEHYRHVAESRRRAEAASDAKSRFLTTVSHELKTPLSGILGLADVLLDTKLSPEQETFARAIGNSGELMLGLVNDMLDFARIEAGRFDLAPRATSLEPTLEGIAELLFSRADAKGLDLATEVDPALPASVMVDPARLRQVLINLAGNAIKFTESGGVAIVAAPDPADATRIRFAVEDTGPGVPPELAERIFDEFEQAETDGERRRAGSGLGLAIARRIVRQMESDIVLTGRPGGGSVFSFSLVLSAASGGDAEPAPGLGGRRALVVAPSGLAPSVLARQLEAAGVKARITDSAPQAAALAGAAQAAGEGYDLLFLDARAADEPATALSVIREAAGAPLPSAVLIAPGRRKSAEEIQADGFGAYLVRPVRRLSLLRIAEQLVAGEAGFRIDPVDHRPQPKRKPPRAGTRRALVAEDDAVNGLLLRSMLLRQGFEVVETSDGAAALEAARAGRFDIILLDLRLPRLDGLAVAAAIRKHEREKGSAPATLMAVTADARPESREAALAAGFDRFVPKPLTPAMLRDILDTARRPSAAA